MKTTSLSQPSTTQPVTQPFALPSLKDLRSIQRAIAIVLAALAAGTLEVPRARALLAGLQIAAVNARHLANQSQAATQPQAATVKTTKRRSAAEASQPQELVIAAAPAIIAEPMTVEASDVEIQKPAAEAIVEQADTEEAAAASTAMTQNDTAASAQPADAEEVPASASQEPPVAAVEETTISEAAVVEEVIAASGSYTGTAARLAEMRRRALTS